MESIKTAIQILNDQGVILCPTDTIWGITCLASSERATQRIMEIKQRPASKSFIVLFHSFQQLNNYFDQIPEGLNGFVESCERPTTIILEGGKNMATAVYGENRSIAFRIVSHGYCYALIKELNQPIVSTSANLSGEPTANDISDIAPIIKDAVQFIPSFKDPIQVQTRASTIVKWTNTGIHVVRP